jgi:N-carbamoyl-L-amino-acid hydrolase
VNDLTVNADRLWSNHLSLAEITDPEQPYMRRSFSNLYVKGREWLVERFRQAGLKVHLDKGGNLIGRREGSRSDTKTIMLGSHSDSVPSGGRFDGISGVLAALEVAHCLKDGGQHLHHGLEIVDFLAEEPSEFGLSCVGSRAMVGMLEPGMLALKNSSGETLDQAVTRMGGDISKLGGDIRNDILAFIELHIEQGPVLEREDKKVGVVTAIAGITRIEVSFLGKAGHAGTVPMSGRQDALCAAADLIGRVQHLAMELGQKNQYHFVATTGHIDVKPNAANVVPGHTSLIIDARAERREMMNEFVDALRSEANGCAKSGNVRLTTFEVLSDGLPAVCDSRLCDLIAKEARSLELPAKFMVSGAGHDAAFLSHVAPTAMIFVPCQDGLSHHPDEWATSEDLADGTTLMLRAVMALDQREIL